MDLKFRIALGLYIGSSAPKVWQKTIEILNKNKSRKEKKEKIIKNMSSILVKDPRGGWGHQIAFEKEPIEIVIKKIVRGLHWYLKGNVMPEDTKFTIVFLKQGEKLSSEVQSILNIHGKNLQRGECFNVQYAYAIDKDYASLWKLSFYKEDCFVVIADTGRNSGKVL